MSDKDSFKMSDLIGKLSKKGAEEMYLQIKELRGKWDNPSYIDYPAMVKYEEQLILKALKEHNIELDLKEEKKRRFKSLLFEIQDAGDRGKVNVVYYNDGSVDGLKLVELPFLALNL